MKLNEKYWRLIVQLALFPVLIMSLCLVSPKGVLAAEKIPPQATIIPVKQKTAAPKTVDKTLFKKAIAQKKKIGTHVNRGDIIANEGGLPGTCGAGLSTGAHLHFEMRQNGSAINPRDLIGKIYIWPLNNFRVTQEFGPADWTPWYSFHMGIDLAANGGYGSPVRAAGPGTIIFNGDGKGYGHLIIIDHGGGLRSYYGHLMCS